MAPNLGWIDVPLGARLARALATAVPIVVMNDADAGVLGEARRGAAVGVDNVLYVSGEVGVGGGMIVDGRLLTGVAGFAGEIGHLTGQPRRPALPVRIDRLLGDRGQRGHAPRPQAGYPADAGRSGIDAVLREAEAGSPSALAALEHVGRWLGIGLAGLINLLNPRLMILGGPHARMHPYVRGVLEAELARYALTASQRSCGRPGGARGRRRSSARRSWPSSPCWRTPPAGSAAQPHASPGEA